MTDPAATGKRRNLTYEEEEVFWAFATIEVLRLTGIRCEEVLELTHHGITEYRLPTTGDLQQRHQLAPSKTDTERLLLVGPRAGRHPVGDHQPAPRPRRRRPAGVSCDFRERVWNAPMPLLFQRSIGSENGAFTPSAIRDNLHDRIAEAEREGWLGEIEGLKVSPHRSRGQTRPDRHCPAPPERGCPARHARFPTIAGRSARPARRPVTGRVAGRIV